jgi:hypothetical protein
MQAEREAGREKAEREAGRKICNEAETRMEARRQIDRQAA